MAELRTGTGRPFSRRAFITAASAAGAGFVLYAALPGGAKVAVAEIRGGTLELATVPKFLTPLLIPPVMPRSETIAVPAGKNVDAYEIPVRKFSQQILPASLPPTLVWGYGAVRSANKHGLLVHTTRRHSRSRRGGIGRYGSSGSTSSSIRTTTTCPTSCRSTDAALGEPARGSG